MTDQAGVLIVGGSVGGLRTAEALRRNGYADPITLLEADGHLPYDRPALSKKLLGAGGAAALRRALAARTPLAQVLLEFPVPAVPGGGAGALQHPAYKML